MAQGDPSEPEREPDVSGTPEGDKDPQNWSKKLQKAPEEVSEPLERADDENSPGWASGVPDKLERNADIRNDLPSTREHPRGHGNERVDETSALLRGTGPGGRMGERVELRSVEVDKVHDNDGNGIHGTQEDPRRNGDERDVRTDAPGRDPGRGGRVQVQDESDDVGRDLERDNDGGGDGHDGRRSRVDGAVSDVRYESKRLGTKTLTTGEVSQHGQRDHKLAHAPRPPTPSSKHLRRPTVQLNSPRRRGKLKTSDASVSTTRPERAKALTKSSGHVETASDYLYMMKTL